MLLRLAYTSTLDPSASDETSIATIVTDAAVRNKASGITGIIAFERSRVCQILEGEPTLVEQLYDSIRRDKRHTNVIELDRADVEGRHFSDWSMVRRPMVDFVMMAYSVIPAG